ncbi:MAG: hypothetical protein JST19_22140 [Bacteroidetes bacterium]|nr:hypothetical protein [Bacteroidota bacterium]
MDSPEQVVEIYSPAAVLNLFNNSISLKETRRLVRLRGVFVLGKGAFYNGAYYDNLRDESSDAQITLVVPALIRNELQPNKTVTLNGFITRRVVNNASRIDIQLSVTDVVEQTVSKYSDQDLKVIELLQAKAAAGFRDVAGFIKEQIVNEQAFRIGVIIGKNAIIDSDIKHQLRESVGFYQIQFLRINLSSEAEIVSAMKQLDAGGTDIVVVSRGGGENLEVFNKPGIAEAATSLKALLVTAIGHKEDVTLLQKVADKAFITPSEFGQFLNDTYNHTVEELQHSRAQLVESVTKQLKAGYEKEIENLNNQIKALEELKKQATSDLQKVYEEKQKIFEQQIEAYKAQLAEKPKVNWTLVILAVIIGLIIGYLLKH